MGLLKVSYILTLSFTPRCDANHEDLDGPSLQRSHTMISALVEELDLGTLWDDYGIVGDVVVRILFIQ